MITEDYVSFETAKLLKEKGFKNSNGMLLGKSGGHYNKNETFHLKDMAIEASIDCEDKCPLVTLQMAMKWLREVHNLCINSEFTIHGWFCSISRIVKNSNGDIVDVEDSCDWETQYCKTYEAACETAIKYCLEDFI